MEVIGRYSNLSHQGEEIEDLLKIVLGEPESPKTQNAKKTFRRLTQKELIELVSAYEAGIDIVDLASLFNIHRNTVSDLLARVGVERRPRSNVEVHREKIIVLYQQGWSLYRIGLKFCIAKGTVARALKDSGVKIRPRNGWKY